jgi:hypothetical protein
MRPLVMKGWEVPTLLKRYCTSPLTTASRAGPAPLYGRCVAVMPVAALKRSPAMWLLPPSPELE